MYGYLRKVAAIILIVFSFIGFIYGETYYNTITFHTQIYNRLRSDGYSPVRQPLFSSNSTQFPYNVVIKSSDPDSSLSIIIDSTYAINNIDLVEELSKYAEIAITVNDSSYLPKETAMNMPAGIRTYISSLQFPEETSVLVLSTDPMLTGDDCVIYPGAAGKLTPYSIFKNTIDALQTEGIPFSIKNGYLSLYRMNATDYSEKLEACLKEGCLAVQMNISPELKKSSLASFVAEFADEQKKTEIDKNTNYTFFRLGMHNIIIPEMFNTVFLVIMTGALLFIVCGLSFTFGKKREQHRSEFNKYWILVPFASFMFLMLFYAAQLTAQFIITDWEQHPLFSLIFKFVLACCYFHMFSLLRHAIKIPCTDFIYGYLLTLSTLINIYVFSAIDLSLFTPFFAACLIAYTSRMTKKTSFLIFFTLLIVTPVILYCTLSLKYIQDEALIKLFDASVLVNTLYSVLILPFMFMVIRITVSTGVPGRLPGRKKRIIIESVASVIITISLIAAAATISRMMPAKHTEQKTIIEETSGVLITSIHKSTKKDRTDFEIVVSSSLPAIRYDISAESDTSMPFLYTDFPYEYDSEDGTISFLLDENPPSPFVLSGSVSPSCSVTFSIVGYMHNDEKLFKETKDLLLTSSWY